MDLSPHVGGRSREMGLGSLSIFGLTEARTKATECRKLTYEGIDPIELVGSSAPMPRLRQPHHWPSRTARSNTLPLTARVGATPSMPRKECNAQDLCRTGDWRAAGPKHRHRPGHEDYRAALVDEAGNSIAAAWPDRGSAGLGNGAGLSPRRQSCALARVEMALAHTINSKVEAAYRRGDLFEKRRLLMAEWAKFCGSTKRDTGRFVRMSRLG